MRYYRVYTGYTEYIPIDSTEMEKAMHAFITGNPVALMDGATTRIDRIVPDFHRAMGWNPTHKLDADDYTELRSKGIDQKYQAAIGKAKDKITYLMSTNQHHLIGKNVKIEELLSQRDSRLIAATSEVADKMKI